MRVVFRVDACGCIGTGHVMRCLNLAEVLRSRDADCVFVHRDQGGHAGDLIRARGFELRLLPAIAPDEANPAGAQAPQDWLGVPVETDIEDTRRALGDDDVDWLVVDHYALDEHWETRLRPRVRRLAVIDDLANRRHDCDLLIDQSAAADPQGRYDGLLPACALRLCGPEYALVAQRFTRARSLIAPRRGPLSRILVYYGGSDPSNETLRALRVLSRAEFAGLAVDVVLGPNHADPTSVRALADTRAHTAVHEPQSDLVSLMLQANCFLGAGGTTTWERCALGLPSVVTTIADNQVHFTRYLHDQGALIYAADRQTVADADIHQELKALLAEPARVSEVARRAWEITDAKGCLRVAEAILPTGAAQLTFTQVSAAHATISGPDELTVAEISCHSSDRVTTVDVRVGDGLAAIHPRESLLDAIVRHAAFNSAPSSKNGSSGTSPACASMRFLRLSHTLQKAPEKRNDEIEFITLLSDRGSWINAYIPKMIRQWLLDGFSVRWIHDKNDMWPGDICFILGCGQLVPTPMLERNTHNLVVHESDLPKGRGWSPLTWQIIEGRSKIPVCLLEAQEAVDSGPVYLKDVLSFSGSELIDEMRCRQAAVTFSLCDEFLHRFPEVVSQKQDQRGSPTFYPRRGPTDSELDTSLSIGEQFEKIRCVDNERYPAFFYHGGRRYILKVFPEHEGVSKDV